MSFAGPSQRFCENMHLNGLDRTVRLRHRRDPTNELSLMSDIAPFSTATTGASPLSCTVDDVPFRALIASALPFT